MQPIKLKNILNEINQEFRSPSGGKITHLFETEKGSKYLFTDKGETKRWKKPGIHVGDEGLKEWYPYSMFVDDKGFEMLQNIVSYIGENIPCTIITEGETAAILMYYNNEWAIPTYDGVQLKFKFSKEPTVGLHAIEYKKKNNGIVNNFHPGHKVSKVKKVEDMDEKEWELFLKK